MKVFARVADGGPGCCLTRVLGQVEIQVAAEVVLVLVDPEIREAASMGVVEEVVVEQSAAMLGRQKGC